MDSSYFVETLYPFQDEVLALLAGLETGFYLSGGTAASRGYLDHRFSDDLDLFVNDDSRFGLWADRLIQALSASKSWRTEINLRDLRFVRASLSRGSVVLKIELINDVPSRVGPIVTHPVLGRLDSAENILANKITAVIDRQEAKDLADIWGFCCLRGLSISAALEGAQGKAAGVFPVDVARVLLSATHEDWQIVRWNHPPEAERFLADLHSVGEGLLLLGT